MTNIIVGLDIGTSFVRAVLGALNEDDSVEVLCVAKRPSMGFVRNGAIINVERMKDIVKAVIDDLEQSFGYEVQSCVTGIGGKYIDSLNSHGLVPVISAGKRDREIRETDIQRVIIAARSILIPPDRETLQVIPKDFIVNGVSGYKSENVLGTQAVRLEVDVHIITASKTQLNSITQCIEHSGYALDCVFLKTLAATNAVMMKNERELGSILIDIGGGSTDVIVIIDDAPACTVSIPVGGNIITNDIAYTWGIPLETAEEIKIKHGCCWDELLADENPEVVVPSVGGRPPELKSTNDLYDLIMPRMRELFSVVSDQIVQRLGLTNLSGSIILTGGGALMRGIVELAQYTFGTNSVRIGYPGQLGGVEESYRSADYATAVGLVLSQKDNLKNEESNNSNKKKKKSESALNREFERSYNKNYSSNDGSSDIEESSGENIISKLKRWFF